ncbi:FAD-binding protein [Chloroflexota bacterium]
MSKTREFETDVLIIGGGVAGSRAAIEAYDRGAKVTLSNKGLFARDGAATWMASTGYNAALYAPDNAETHAKDTIVAGRYIGQQELISTLVDLIPQTVKDLYRWGMKWEKDSQGKFQQTALPCETHWRCLKPIGGRPNFKRAFIDQMRRREINLIENMFVTDLLTSGNAVVGAVGVDVIDGAFQIIRAKATVLATGGAAGCFRFHSNGNATLGDGMAMAYRAGACLKDMEFQQFIPACPVWPLSAAGGDAYKYLTQIYGHLYNNQGERFMERYCPVTKEWSSRQELSRCIDNEVRARRGTAHGGVYLGLNHLPRNILGAFLEYHREDSVLRKLREAGIDPYQDAFEVGIPAHYSQGGCSINERCESSLEGLYVVGEAAAGVDGADRLAGNALPFCMAMGMVGGREASRRSLATNLLAIDQNQLEELREKAYEPLSSREPRISPTAVKQTIQETMDAYAVFSRNKDGLESALKIFGEIREKTLPKVATHSVRCNLEWVEAMELRNIIDVAEIICQSALMRTESRGAHERSDYPREDPGWLKNNTVEKVDGKMVFTKKPVSLTYYQPEEANE